jgi:hypothetical protein
MRYYTSMIWSDYPGVAARFDAKIDRTGQCHLWLPRSRAGGKSRAYGSFHLAKPVRRMEYAHRLEMIRKLGRDLAPGEYVLHSCDTPLCVNPQHLRLGTQTDNMREASGRGRTSRGERHTSARLTEQQVREILALLKVKGTRHQDIAERYGVSRPAISLISSGKNWAHLQEEVR